MIGSVLDHLWQSMMVAACLGLLAWSLQRRCAAVRYRLWFLSSVKFLIPVSLIPLLGIHLQHSPTQLSVVSPAMQMAVAPFAVLKQRQEPLLPTNPAREDSKQSAVTDHLLPLAFELRLPQILLGVWLCGAVVLLARWLYRWAFTVRLVREADLLPIEELIPVRSSVACTEPSLVGIAHPVLLLPHGIQERLNPMQLHAVLQHELAHLRRRDNLTAAIHMFTEVVFWFFPPVWWIGRRLLIEREAACDETVLMSGCDPASYAETILTICRWYVHPGPSLAAGVAGADLKRRVEAIMAPQQVRPLGPVTSVIVTVIASLTIVSQIAMAVTLAPVSTQPQRSMLSADRSLSRQLLRNGEYAALEARMSAFQKSFETGAVDDYTLLQEFYAFFVPEAALQPALDGWIDAYPKSYAAYTARAMFNFASGLQTRGNQLAAHTTREQMRGMTAYLKLAERDIGQSLNLTAKPLVSYNVLIRISMEYGHHEEARTYLDAALKLSSQAFIARRPYMRSLESRWGGDLQQMEDFLTASREAGLLPAQVQDLESLVAHERVWLTHWSAKSDTAVDDE